VEDSSWGNLKMTIMTTASVSALVAQFYPLTFPDNIWILGVCVVIYFALSGVLQFMVTFLEKDFIYGSAPMGGNVAILRSTLPKGSQVYTLTAEFPKGTQVARLVRSVGQYYRKSGFLVPENVERDIKGVFCGPWRAALAALQVRPLPPVLPPEALGGAGFSAWAEFFRPRLEAALAHAGSKPSGASGLWEERAAPAALSKVYLGWRAACETLKARDAGAYGRCFREEAVKIMGEEASEEYSTRSLSKEQTLKKDAAWAVRWDTAFEVLASSLKLDVENKPRGELARFKGLLEAAERHDPRLRGQGQPASLPAAAASSPEPNPTLEEKKKA